MKVRVVAKNLDKGKLDNDPSQKAGNESNKFRNFGTSFEMKLKNARESKCIKLT